MLQSTASLTAAALVAAAAGVAALVVVVRRRPGPVRPHELVVPLGAIGAVAACAAVVTALGAAFSPIFPVAHLAYLVAVLALPALGLAALVAVLVRRGARVVAVVAVAMVLPALVGFYATHVEPNALDVDRASLELPAARAGDDPLRVGVLADLQTNAVGAHEREAVDRLMAQRPDVILLPGDVFQGDEAQFRAALPDLRRLFGRLRAPGGVYAVRGDTDTGERADLVYAGTDVVVLDDEAAAVRVGDRRVRVGGNVLLWAGIEGRALRADLSAADPDEVRLLLVHRPDAVLGLAPDQDVDLVVAGHTHGGQIALPIVGPLVSFSEVPRSVAGGGLHEVGGHPIYVSTGVGLVRNQAPQVRFGARPSVGIVTLR